MADKTETGDVWNVVEFKTTEKTWSERDFKEKLTFLGILLVKLVLMVLLLYLFIISLDLMSNAFRIIGGKPAGRAFRNSDFFDNPLSGLVTGILVTVLVQSSSTSTSIIITMTAGNLIEVKNAIPMIMGANIGTSVTNTIVSLGEIHNRDEYRRAFAGATVHDCFNFLTVLILLPIEAVTGVLRHIASAICDGFDITDDEEKGAKTDFLKKLTKPVASRLLGIDKKLITKIAAEQDDEKLKDYEATSIIKHKQKDDQHIFLNTPMSDGEAGWLMVIVSLIFLCICLMLLVKLLQTIFRGRIAIWFRAALNLEIKAVPPLANYILIFFGMCITILFQSSSITTSTLTPLVGIGLVRLDKMFAFTVGANIGTTITGILSALVSDKRKTGLTVAFTHTLFNLIGTLIWYPVPMMRRIPIEAAKINGNVAADVRWFPVAYILTMFQLIPAILLGLSLASPWLAVFVGIPFLLMIVAIYGIIGLREFYPDKLPLNLRRNPRWLPISLRAKSGSEEEAVAAPPAAATSSTKAADADLGAGQWELAPAAWGTAWFVLLALLVVVPNCQWGFIKYTSWDARDHFGIGAWETCSYAFEEEKQWAPLPDPAQCTFEHLNTCGSKGMSNCLNNEFSSTDGAYLAYQDSWKSCRSMCTALQWEAWCVDLSCTGGQHVKQCNNVTTAVRGVYDVEYVQSSGVAWAAGDRCRNIEELCPGLEGDLKVAGDLSVVGLVCVGLGLITLLLFLFMNGGKRDFSASLKVSLGAMCCASIFLFASWVKFSLVLGQDTTCIVEAESHTGAVWAHGHFSDIFAAGAYAHGFVIGAWALLMVTMLLVVLRINQGAGNTPQEENKPVDVENKPVDVENKPVDKEIKLDDVEIKPADDVKQADDVEQAVDTENI